MARLKRRIELLVILLATLLYGVSAYSVNTTVYDTDPEHISYAPKGDFCVSWMSCIFWQSCWTWARPWSSQVIRNGRQFATVHRSLNHQLATLTIQFSGSAVWVYGPSRAQLSVIPPEYKVCLYENHHLASEPVCYRVDVAASYSRVGDREGPVVVFAKGDLQFQEHRVVISIADPIDETNVHEGIQFSHAVYTIPRPTPWPVEEDHWRFRQVIMHDTHPLLSYWPVTSESPCSLLGRGLCSKGWIPCTYRAEDGTMVPCHELRAKGDQFVARWGVQATITAGAVAVYGIPQSHIQDTSNLGPICVQIDSGRCEIVDLQRAYLNAGRGPESVLLWKNNALDPSRSTRIFVRLLNTGDGGVRVFPFKEIRYSEPQEYASPDPPVGHLENHDISHENWDMQYHPGRRCVRHFMRWCTKWYDPWVWREEGPRENRITFRSIESSYRTTESPAITVDFRGSAVYVYGAPRSFVRDSFASQKVCINDKCQIIDVQQAYLNALHGPSIYAAHAAGGSKALAISANKSHAHESKQENITTGDVATTSGFHPELEPVLIWSMTGLDDMVQHTVRLALGELPCSPNAEMTIAKVAYTSVSYDPGQSRPETPVPQPDTAYRGPAYPPYATKWILGAPLIALPAPPSLRGQMWQIVIFVAFIPFLLLVFRRRMSDSRSYSSTAPPHPNRPAQPVQPWSHPWFANATQASSSRTTSDETRPENQNNHGPIPGFNLASPTPILGAWSVELSYWLPQNQTAPPPPPLAQTQRAAPSPHSYTQTPTYYTGSQIDTLPDSLTVVSETATILPMHHGVSHESFTRHQRAAELATQQSALFQNHQP